jgi:hypothetical protein
MRKSLGRWVVEYFASNGDIQTRFFHSESDARKYSQELYREFLIPCDVFRDDFKVYADLANQGLL